MNNQKNFINEQYGIQQNIQLQQQQLYYLQSNMYELRNLIQRIVVELENIWRYMLYRFQNNEVSLEELYNVNYEIDNFKNTMSIDNINTWLDKLNKYIHKRGYNSLSPQEKFNIYSDKIMYGYTQVQLEEKYFTYQSVISRVLKEFEMLNSQNPYEQNLNKLNYGK